MTKIYRHPFTEGIERLIGKHFHPSIAKLFDIRLEANLYKQSKEVKQMLKDDRIVAEVYYKEGDTAEYVCDLYGWVDKGNTEARLLQFITDAYKSGRIGADWLEDGGTIRRDLVKKVSREVSSGKHETPLTEDEL